MKYIINVISNIADFVKKCYFLLKLISIERPLRINGAVNTLIKYEEKVFRDQVIHQKNREVQKL